MSELQYLILDRIAVGGMAEVFRAKSMGVAGFEKIVAIKRILPQLSEDAEFVQMFVEEAKIAGRLRHANIARILELGKIQDTHFIAMEYIFGKDLVQIAEQGQRTPPKMAAWVISNVLAGLDYAHRQRGADGQPLGLIHRDVSPRNVLVSHDGLVKLIDFGIAKAASRATQTVAGVIKGKLGYMSPEQITGLQMDHRSDIFSASTCLHEMLTGQRLFAGRNEIDTMDAVRAAVADPPSSINPEVPAELDAIVMKGLARQPDGRWQTAGEMHEALTMFAMATRPAFGSAQLRDWMRSTFAEEMATQSAHLERLADVSEPGVQVAAPDSEPSGEFDPWDDEPTTVGLPPPELSGGYVELSSLVVIEDRFSLPGLKGVADPLLGGEAAAVAEAEAAFEAAFEAVFEAEAEAEAQAQAHAEAQAEAAFEAAFAASLAASAPVPIPESVFAPESESVPVPVLDSAPESEAESRGVRSTLQLERISRPDAGHCPPPTNMARPSPAPEQVSQPAPAPAKTESGGNRWGTLLAVAFFALLLGVGSVVLFLYMTGRGLPFTLPSY